MNAEALRLWGIAAGAVVIAGALALSFTAPAPQAEAQGLAQIAQAETPRAQPVAFLVRFRGSGPIARGQATAQRGQLVQGQRAIEAQLRRQAEFRGLCFDRFTVGAAEVVLRTCVAIVASERAGVQQSWLTRLRAMPGVAYVDANATAGPGRAG